MSRPLFCTLLVIALFNPLVPAQSAAPGTVYTSTNAADANQVAVYTRAADGTLTFDEFVDTGGTGTGEGLGSQGAVLLSQDQSHLFVVNAGSDEISVLRVLDDTLQLVGVVGSRGSQPVSLTQHDGLLYVLNAASDGIAGFRIQEDGTLKYVPGSKKKLGDSGTLPAQIGFSPDGGLLYVTERATNQIARFKVKKNDKPSSKPLIIPSAGPEPFGFAFGFRGQLFVSEAANMQAGASSVSSYEIQANGDLQPVTSSLGTTQTSACWLASTPDRRLFFVTNTGSDSVSTFSVGFDGALTLDSAVAASPGDGPTDMAVTPDGRFFYVLAAGAGEVVDYDIAAGGVLSALIGTNSGLPSSAAGLAAR